MIVAEATSAVATIGRAPTTAGVTAAARRSTRIGEAGTRLSAIASSSSRVTAVPLALADTEGPPGHSTVSALTTGRKVSTAPSGRVSACRPSCSGASGDRSSGPVLVTTWTWRPLPVTRAGASLAYTKVARTTPGAREPLPGTTSSSSDHPAASGGAKPSRPASVRHDSPSRKAIASSSDTPEYSALTATPRSAQVTVSSMSCTPGMPRTVTGSPKDVPPPG